MNPSFQEKPNSNKNTVCFPVWQSSKTNTENTISVWGRCWFHWRL